jgi:hypothetical protein
MTSQAINYLLNKVYKIEDKVVRTFRNLPSQKRVDSYPFLSSDTYFFQSDIRIESGDNIRLIIGADESSIIYLNGNLSGDVLTSLIQELKKRRLSFARLIVGDSDYPLEESVLSELKPYFVELYCVNYCEETIGPIKNLPLGLESQRYRSAGQIRDFKKLPSYESLKRPHGILVAWNDDTYINERKMARELLRVSPFVYEFSNRVPARLIHKMMRSSKLVACPRGNGIDTHRFWESLYLGALPVILKGNRLSSQTDWPCLEIDSWQEVNDWTSTYLKDIYESKVPELREFRVLAHRFVDYLGGKDV